MAIQQNKKQSDLEKRLWLLRRQVYGKNPEELRKTQNTRESENQIIRNSYTQILRPSGTLKSSESFRNESFRSDLTYLHQDLLKILTFASLAIGAQIVLFILLQNHLLRISL